MQVFINFAKRQTDGVASDGNIPDIETGHDHLVYDGDGSGRKVKPGSISPHGSTRILREDQVRKSLDSIKHGYNNQSYDESGEAARSGQAGVRLYPSLDGASPVPQPIGPEPSQPQAVSVFPVGESDAPVTEAAAAHTAPAGVSQITVGLAADDIANVHDPDYVSSVHVGGVSPPTSSTTSPEQPRRADSTTGGPADGEVSRM